MASTTDRNGIVTNYKYDVFGRLIEENAGGQKHTYTYDGNNNILTMNDSSGVTTMTYDILNRNTSKTVPSIGKTSYIYDIQNVNSWLGSYSIRITDPKGNITLKTYDGAGFLNEVKIGDNNPTKYNYYPNGNKYSVIYPDGLTQSYSYDTMNQIVSLVNSKSDKTTISSYTYTYDNAGNQLTKVDSKGKTTYTYDALNRLSTVKEPSGKLTAYQYDGAGNRSVEKVTSSGITVTTDYTYNQLNRLIQTKSSIGEMTKYSYDNNGNMLSKTSSSIKLIPTSGTNTPVFSAVVRKDSAVGSGNSKITLYTYDNYNQLTKMKNETSTSTYGYNADGYRVSKTVNGKTSRYLYENDKIVLETDSSNKQLAYQVYGAYLIYRSTLNESGVGSEAYYYLYNAQGDVTGLIDTKGTIAATYEYDAFGNIISETGSANNPIRYAGYQYDKETGLYYLNARYYDSSIARFINEDTYLGEANDPLSLNLYTYCVNNPIEYHDPSGHRTEFTDGGGYGIGSNGGAGVGWIVYEIGEKIIKGILVLFTGNKVKETVIIYSDSKENTVSVDNTSGNSKDKDTNKEKTQGDSEAVPDKAKDVANQVKDNNGAPPKGYKGGSEYKNQPKNTGDQKLPEDVKYKEYDVDPYVKGQNRGTERIVIGDDGSVWYTNDHYHSFTQIK